MSSRTKGGRVVQKTGLAVEATPIVNDSEPHYPPEAPYQQQRQHLPQEAQDNVDLAVSTKYGD